VETARRDSLRFARALAFTPLAETAVGEAADGRQR